MHDRLRSVPGWAGQEPLESEVGPPEIELCRLRKVTSGLLREALDEWAELWEEFQDQVVCGVTVLPEAPKGFQPRCGWPEFLEKMWRLKLCLDAAKRFCERRQ